MYELKMKHISNINLKKSNYLFSRSYFLIKDRSIKRKQASDGHSYAIDRKDNTRDKLISYITIYMIITI